MFAPARLHPPVCLLSVRPSLQVENDRRFSNKDKKFLASTTFPPNFSQKVNLKKVNAAVFRPWVVKETERLLGFEDEVVVEFVVRLLARSSSLAKPCPA